jgi:hypothetical protein
MPHVFTQGNLMEVKVTAASTSDLSGGKKVLAWLKERFPRLKRIWGDSHYGDSLIEWVKEHLGCKIEVVRRLGTRKRATRWSLCNVSKGNGALCGHQSKRSVLWFSLIPNTHGMRNEFSSSFTTKTFLLWNRRLLTLSSLYLQRKLTL